MSTDTTNETGVSNVKSDPIVQIQVDVTTDATAAANTSLSGQLPDRADDIGGDGKLVQRTPKIRKWWRAMWKSEPPISNIEPNPIEAVHVVVTMDASTDADTSLLGQLPDWADEFDDEETPVQPTPTINLSNPKDRKKWWRGMATSTAIATLCWEKAIRGTNYTKLIAQDTQWIIVALLPSDAWFRPLRDHLGLQRRAVIHEAIPQVRRRGSDEGELDKAVRQQSAIFVLASDGRNITPAVRSAADLTIVVSPPDIELVRRLLLRTGRGSVPRQLDPSLIAGLDYSDLCATIRPGRRVSETLAALAQASASRVRVLSDSGAPALDATKAFGMAGVWGIQLAHDIADYRAGKITWTDVDRGALLYGPPGTGKTLFAQSLAQYCKVPIIITTISDYFAGSPGDLDSVIKAQREVFARASALKPSILFLDEIDAIPDRRTLSPRGRDWWMPVINDFLTLLDSATSSRAGVVVIGATNRIEAIDPAILRPGRLERSIEVSVPDAEGLVDMMRYHLGDDLKTIDLMQFARTHEGATGAVVMEWVRAARRVARTANRSLELVDLEFVTSSGAMTSPADLLRAAIHEAGHAVVILAQGRKLVSVVLDPGGAAGGRVRAEPRATSLLIKQDMFDECIILLAGRAAEEAILGYPSSGAGGSAGSDLARATELLLWAHRSLGFGTDLVYGGPPETIEGSAVDPWLRLAITKDLTNAYSQALDIVRERRAQIEAIATVLRELRLLSGADVDELLSARGD